MAKYSTKSETEAAGYMHKTALKMLRLKPIPETPFLEYWQGRGVVRTYLVAGCAPMRPVRPMTAAQSAALAAGRLLIDTKLCKICSSRFERGGECQICAENRFVSDRIDANAEAINSAKRLLETEFLVLDTETTGLDSDAEIIEIAILDQAGNVLFESYVKPMQPCSPEAEEIHKITPEILANAPTWPEIHEQVFNILNSQTVAIYNAAFDVRLIEQTCKKYALTAPKYNAVCIMLTYSKYDGEWNDYFNNWRWHKLTIAARDLNCYERNAHRAAADCRMALGVLRGIARG